MQIVPSQISTGIITLKNEIPALFLGRNVIVTVLSKPKDGMVLVSLFGKRLFVETTMNLEKGQVLNLKVHSLEPKVMLKPFQVESETIKANLKVLDSIIQGLADKLDKETLKLFSLKEIFKTLTSGSGEDLASPLVISTLLDQVAQYPLALAYLIVPIGDNETSGRARVAIERDGDAYQIIFQMETDNLGLVECTARMDEGIEVEIRTGSTEVTEFLNAHIQELYEGLAPLGIKRLQVLHTKLKGSYPEGVNVLV